MIFDCVRNFRCVCAVCTNCIVSIQGIYWLPDCTHNHIAPADLLHKNPVPRLEHLPGIADILNLVIGCFPVNLDGKPAPAN